MDSETLFESRDAISIMFRNNPNNFLGFLVFTMVPRYQCMGWFTQCTVTLGYVLDFFGLEQFQLEENGKTN